MAKNGVFVFVKFSIYTLSGVLFIPFLVRQYGSGAYGLIALAGFLTQYVGLVSRCIGNSTARFLNIALNRNDWNQANEIFSTAIVANLVLIFLQLPLFVLGIWKLNWLIDFQPEIGTDFRILVACNVVVFYISVMSGVLSTPVQAANRLDISTSLESVHLILRIVLIYALIKLFGAQLWLIGVVDLGLTLVRGIIFLFIQRRLAPGLSLRKKYITRKWIRPVLNMSGWALLSVLGGALFLKTDVWMINRFVNKELAGIYAALLVWPNFLKQISKQADAVLTPVYMIDYAKGDMDRIAQMSMVATKLLGCFIALIVGVMWVVASWILELWLGEWAVGYTALFRMMIVYVVFAIGESVLWPIFVAVNKVHVSGLVNVSMGVANIVISMTLIWLGFGAMGVAVGTAIAAVLGGGVVLPMGACHVLKIPPMAILKYHSSAAILLLSAWGFTQVVVSVGRISTIAAVLTGVALFTLGGGFVCRTVFSAAERSYVRNLFNTVMLQFRTRRSPSASTEKLSVDEGL